MIQKSKITIVEYLEFELKNKNISMEELPVKAGVAPMVIMKLKRGELHTVHISNIFKISQYLKINPVNLLRYFPEDETIFDIEDQSLIKRSIEFPPEYHSAGIAILQNFGSILRHKYPNTASTVLIKQEGLKVKMVITPPEGKIVEIEECLSLYGLVVKGERPVEDLLSEPLLIMELKTEIKMAQTRVELQKEHMTMLNQFHTKRISSLEEEVDWLRGYISDSLSARNNEIKNLLNVINTININNNEIVNGIITAFEDKDADKLEKSMQELQSQEPKKYSMLKKFAIDTAANASGAALPSWVQFLLDSVL